MLRTNLWNKSVPVRVELDQRSREARLRLERIERLLVPRAAVTNSRAKRLLCLLTSVLAVRREKDGPGVSEQSAASPHGEISSGLAP
jgi:type II secretory pathway component HofQ